MNGLLCKSQMFIKRHSSTILTCVGAAGVVATSIMAVKATPKAIALLEKAEDEKGAKLTRLETIQIAGPTYVPSVITGMATIGCIFGANVLNKRKQAALTSAYALLNNSYNEYKKKVEELYGEEADLQVRESLARDKYEESDISFNGDKTLFYDECSERYFESTMETVLRAEYEINKKISTFGGAKLNEFYEHLDIPQTDYGEYAGWSIGSLMANKWTQWLDFTHIKVVMDDGLECYIISMSDEPLFEYEYY